MAKTIDEKLDFLKGEAGFDPLVDTLYKARLAEKEAENAGTRFKETDTTSDETDSTTVKMSGKGHAHGGDKGKGKLPPALAKYIADDEDDDMDEGDEDEEDYVPEPPKRKGASKKEAGADDYDGSEGDSIADLPISELTAKEFVETAVGAFMGALELANEYTTKEADSRQEQLVLAYKEANAAAIQEIVTPLVAEIGKLKSQLGVLYKEFTGLAGDLPASQTKGYRASTADDTQLDPSVVEALKNAGGLEDGAETSSDSFKEFFFGSKDGLITRSAPVLAGD